MPKKKRNEYWAEDGQIHFINGKGYGLAPRFVTIYLGEEEDIKRFFETGEVSDKIDATQQVVLEEIRTYRDSLSSGIIAAS